MMKSKKNPLLVLLLSLLIFGCGPSVRRIIVTPESSSGKRGEKIEFMATVVGINDPSQDVTWSVSGGVEGTTISSDGVLTIGSQETAGNLLVTATSVPDNKKSGTGEVKVQDPLTFASGVGLVFFDKGEFSNGWRYLEAAPASSEFVAQWGLNGKACPGTSGDIGAGKANTAAIIKALNANGETQKAAQLCAALSINGLNDWFLPNENELYQMYENLNLDGNKGGFQQEETYWSSSAMDDTDGHYTACLHFGDGSYGFDVPMYSEDRTSELRVRAVRVY